jgi:hypothetical protein
MRIEFTEHAQQQMRRRKIELRVVIETIKRPEMLRKTATHHYARRTFKKRVLQVVYIKETNIRVLTAYWRE